MQAASPSFVYILAAVAGLFAGSFLNVVIYRLPRSEGVFFGRSRCPACGRELSWPDLLPVISYLLLKGRCRRCGAPIAPRYLFVELLTACVFAWFYAVFGLTPLLGKYLLLASLLIAASFIDLEHYLIPDRLVAAGFLGGLALGFLPGDAGLGAGLEGAAAAGGVLLLVAILSRGGMGGGDVKLAGVIGLFLGWPLALLAIFWAFCLGGLAGAVLLLAKRKGRKDPLPFGPFLSAGAVLALVWGKNFLFWYGSLTF